MSIHTIGTAKMSKFSEYINWYTSMSYETMNKIWENTRKHIYGVTEVSSDIRKIINKALSEAFECEHLRTWLSSTSAEQDADYMTEKCEKNKKTTLSSLKRFSQICSEYSQNPTVAVWEEDMYAYIHIGNAERGIIVIEPEKWLEYIPPVDYSHISPAQLLESAGCSDFSPVSSLVPVNASNITHAQLEDIAGENARGLEDIQREIEAVKNAETDELAEIQKIIREQQALLEKKQQEMMAELEAKKAEMEVTKEKLEGQIWLLDSQIYAIRCYTGETISFAKIRSGKNAPDGEPIIIHQKLRYLDEDLGRLTSLYKLDWKDINVFEDFLKYSPIALDVFAPNERCITLCRLSKDGKIFARNVMFPYANVLEDYEYYHGKTVGIIIRNGENLYLGWTDNTKVHIQDDFIRSKANPFDLTFMIPPEEFRSEYERKTWEKERKEKVKQTADDIVSRVFVMNILQGVIERTQMLPLPKGERVTQESKYIQYSLSDLWLTDNRFGSFTSIVEKCNARVMCGDTILTVQSLWPSHQLYARNNDRGRRYADRTHDCSVDDCTIYKVNLIEEDTSFRQSGQRIFVSVKKEYSPFGARSNFEVFKEEYINLTYMNSVWLEWVINNKTLGGWRAGGRSVNYAYAIRYLNTALDFVRKRERDERAFLEAVEPDVCKDPEWPVKLSEWKLEKGVREINEYQAKRFCKSAVTDAEKKIPLLFPISYYLFPLQDVQAHEIEPDEMHGVLVEMRIVLLLIPMTEFVISPYNIGQLIEQAVELSDRVMLEVDIREDLSFSILARALIDKESDIVLAHVLVPILEGSEGGVH